MKRFLIFFTGVALLLTSTPAFASKKDFKGLFGSYKRERFVENEARESDMGIDLGLSTLLPMTDVVRSSTSRGDAGAPLYYATFFNVEASFLYSLWYNWQFYASISNFSYDTRHENPNPTGDQTQYPVFHEAEFQATPILAGVRYRFSTEDIVPYIGVGAGMSMVRRKASFDNSTILNGEDKSSVLTAQLQAGLEFYVSPRAGIRLEVSGYYMQAKQYTYDVYNGSGGNLDTHPLVIFQPNVFSMRYSSGFFYLF